MVQVEVRVPVQEPIPGTSQVRESWKTEATYDGRQVGVIEQDSDVGLSTVVEIGNLAGPHTRFMIPGTSSENATAPTEQRLLFTVPSSDYVELFAARPGKTHDVQVRSYTDGSSHLVWDSEKVERIAIIRQGENARVTSQNGHLQRHDIIVE